MKAFWHIAKREIGLLLANKTMILFAIILPFISILFFNTLLSVGVVRNLPIAVVDLDQSSISRNLISQLNATPELKIEVSPTSQADGERLIREGVVYGLVIIPNNFSNDIRQGKQTTVINQYNGSILLAGGLENKAFKRVVGTLSAGINIQKQMKQGVNMHQAKIKFQSVGSSNHVLSNPYTNYSYYLNSGFLTMFFQLFVILTTIYCFGSDLKYNKGVQLFRISNGNLITILAGKTLPYTLWFLFVGLIMYYSMFILQDFPLYGNKLAILLALVLLIIANQSFAILFIAISKSLREALTIGSGFTAVSLSFSGITFPIFGMPLLMQWMSQVFPFTHYFDILLDQTQRGFPVYYSLNAIGILTMLCIVPILHGWFKLKKLFLKGEFLHRI